MHTKSKGNCDKKNLIKECSVQHIPDGENLSKVKLIVIDLSDKNSCQGFIQSSAVHVYGGTNGEHKAGHAFVHLVVFLQAFEGDRQCGRAARRQKGQETVV